MRSCYRVTSDRAEDTAVTASLHFGWGRSASAAWATAELPRAAPMRHNQQPSSSRGRDNDRRGCASPCDRAPCHTAPNSPGNATPVSTLPRARRCCLHVPRRATARLMFCLRKPVPGSCPQGRRNADLPGTGGSTLPCAKQRREHAPTPISCPMACVMPVCFRPRGQCTMKGVEMPPSCA